MQILYNKTLSAVDVLKCVIFSFFFNGRSFTEALDELHQYAF